MDLSQFKTVEQLAAAIKTLDMVTSIPWQDYDGSTIDGFSAVTSHSVQYKKIFGKTILADVYIRGTSDDTMFTFTMPYTRTASAGALRVVCIVADNGGTSQYGHIDMPANSDIVTVYLTPTSAVWTNANIKRVNVQFWYEAAQAVI